MTMQKTYADALFSLAVDESIEGIVLDDFELLNRVLTNYPEISTLMASPRITKMKRAQLIDLIFGDYLSPILCNFMKLLMRHHLFYLLPGCYCEYRQDYNEKHGILEVTAVTVMPLNQEQREQIIRKIENRTGKSVCLTEQIDASCLGGIKIMYPGKLIDDSLQKTFQSMAESLRQLKIKAGQEA